MNAHSFGRAGATNQIPASDVLLRDGQRMPIGGLTIRSTPKRLVVIFRRIAVATRASADERTLNRYSLQRRA